MKSMIDHKQSTVSLAPKLLPEAKQQDSNDTCSQCGGIFNITTTGRNSSSIIYCKECGSVQSADSIVKNGSRIVNHENTQCRNGASVLDLEQREHRTIAQLWLSYFKASDQTEKNFALILAEITRIVHVLPIKQHLAAQAAEICKQAFEKGLVRGNSLSVLAAASVYASARLASVPITAEEIAAKSSLPKSGIIHCFRRLQRKLRLTFTPPSLEAHVASILNIVSIDPDGQLATAAKKILETAEKNGVTQGRNPAAVAAAVIYAASLKVSEGSSGLTQRKLAYAANVTETTIRRVCQILDL